MSSEKKSKQKRLKNYACTEVKNDDLIFAAFDSETDGLGGKILSLQLTAMGERHFITGDDLLGRAFAIMAQYPVPVIWYAFHAQYDWRYILPWLLDHDYAVDISMRTETDIYQIQVQGPHGIILMRDAAALFKPGTSLASFAESFTPEIPKLEIDIAHFDPANPEHQHYAMRDVDILQVGMGRVDTLLRKHFGVGLGHTAAGTAMKAWQHSIPKGTYYKSSEWGENEEFIRQGYYGGLVFLTRDDLHESFDSKPVCRTYDINSSYPSVMCDFGVPDGRIAKTLDYQQKCMGIYHVRITAPDDLIIPIIPARNERGAMRWQRGTFNTICTNRELIFAVKHGYIIQDIFRGIVFEDTIFPFNEFIENCKAIRQKFKGQTEEELAKLMQNSLYGKFGSRRLRCSIFQLMNDEDGMGCVPLDIDGRLWVKQEFSERMKCRPEWAVFITAHARLKLLQAAYSVGVENVVYGDTDSLTILAGHESGIDVGMEYGQFKLEKEWRRFRAIAPKVYSGELMSGQYRGAAKGLPKKGITEKQWVELLHTGASSAEALSLSSLKIGLKNGMEPATVKGRVSSSLENSVNFERCGFDTSLTNSIIRPRIASC